VKIIELYKSRLRNDEHFMYHTEARDLLAKTAALKAKIQTQFDAYDALLNKEDEGLKKIIKSALTAKIHDEDKIRDEIYAGMTELTAAMLKHPVENKREAAKRLKIVFDTYGHIAKKTINEQTSAAINILQELKGAYAQDAQTIGLNDYIPLFETHNNALEALVKERYDETAAKTDVVIREARLKVDAAYEDIAARINAIELLEGGELCENFIKTLNAVIAKYHAIINARAGRRHNKTEAVTPNAGTAEGDSEDGQDYFV
jgi:hypothetical protein